MTVPQRFPFLFILFVLFQQIALSAGNSKDEPSSKKLTSVPGFFYRNPDPGHSGFSYCLKTTTTDAFIGPGHVMYRQLAVRKVGDAEVRDSFMLELSYAGANPRQQFEELDSRSGTCNFILGNDSSKWIRNYPTFGTLVSKDLYPGIDLKYYDYRPSFKTDYIVHPGADPRQILINYKNAKHFEILPTGELQITLGNNVIREHIPKAYQEFDTQAKLVPVKYMIINDSLVGFEVGKYNPEVDLVIDPVLIFSTFIGGSGDDCFLFSSGISRDASGFIHTAGRVGSANFPVTPGAYDVTYNGGTYDVAVMKLSADGDSMKYCTFLGGSGYDGPYDLEMVSSDGAVAVIVGTQSSNFPSTAGTYQPVSNTGPTDISIVKLDALGYPVFATFIGGFSDDIPYSIAVDQTGNFYFCGQSKGGFPTTAGVYQQYSGATGYWDVIVGKLNSTGTSLLWATYLGGSSDDKGVSVVVDNSNNVYVSGGAGLGFPVTPGAYDVTYNGGTFDVFLAKLSPNGSNLLYSTFLGGPNYDAPKRDLILDASGQVTLTGYCGSGFPTTAGAYNVTYNGGTSDMFVAKMNSSGTALVFSTYLGTAVTDEGRDIMVRPNGDIVITGYAGIGYPTTACAYDQTYNGGPSDAVISILNPTATQMLYSTYIGGGGTDIGMLLLDDNPDIYLMGETTSSNFPVTAGSLSTTYNGGSNDIFYLKLSPGNVTATFNAPLTVCLGNSITFTNTTVGATSCLWNFGDLTTSTATSPSHIYTSTGTFNVTMIATAACGVDTAYATVVVTAGVNTPQTLTICQGDSIMVGNVYHSAAGIYHDTLQMQVSGCDSVVVTTLLVGTNVYNNLSYAICQGDSLFAGGAFQHIAGIYYDTLSGGSGGCDSVIVTTLSLHPSYLVSATAQICTGDSIFIGGAFQHLAGIYNDTLFTVHSCDSVIQTTLSLLLANQSVTNVGICSGDSVMVFGTYQHLAGQYSDTLTNIAGCDSITVVNLLVHNLPQITLPDDTSFCSGFQLVLNAQNPGSLYLWNNGEQTQTIVVLASGTYSVTVTDANGCTDADSTMVNIIPGPLLSLFPANAVICRDSILKLTVTGAQTYLWTPASGLSSTDDSIVWATPPSTITYQVTGFMNNGCESDTSVHVTVVEPPEVNLPDSLYLCEGEVYTLDAGGCFECSYLWNTNSTNASLNINTTGIYSVRVSKDGCSIRDSVLVIDCMEIWIPNVFTPNHDNLNETFHVKGINIESFHMYIFNRWGNQLWETYSILPGWDGMYKGKLCADGVYVYLIEYSGHGSGQKKIKKRVAGTVTLLR